MPGVRTSISRRTRCGFARTCHPPRDAPGLCGRCRIRESAQAEACGSGTAAMAVPPIEWRATGSSTRVMFGGRSKKWAVRRWAVAPPG